MEIPEPLVPQVAQLKAEREACEAHGNTDRVAAIDRQLAAFGIGEKAEEKREESKKTPPQGRQVRQQQQTKG